MEPVTAPAPPVTSVRAPLVALLALAGWAGLAAAGAALEPTPVRFQVAGSARIAGEYGFADLRVVRRQFGASEFRLRLPLGPQTDWLTDEGGSGALVTDSLVERQSAVLVLPLDDLPVAAEILSFTCRFRDFDDLADLSADFSLQRRDRRSTVAETLAAVSAGSSGDSTSLVSFTDTSITSPFVQESFHYWISVTFRVEAATPLLAFYGCELRYAVDRIDTR